MRVPSSQVRIQICKCIISFYKMELPKKLLPGKAQCFQEEMSEEICVCCQLILNRSFDFVIFFYITIVTLILSM